MSVNVAVGYEGASINSCDGNTLRPFDIHCPLMGTGLNYWEAECIERRKSPLHNDTCHPSGCLGLLRHKENQTHKASSCGVKGKRITEKREAVILNLAFNEKMPLKDIADTLNIKLKTVMRYLSCAARKNK